jgi:hypothetical protein
MQRKRPSIIATRPAGPDHAVLAIEGGIDHRYRRQPCADCPWRRDRVGEFPAEAFRQSAVTGIDPSSLPWKKDPGLAQRLLAGADHTFACHESGPVRPAVCAGYILRGDQALAWRVAFSRGQFDPKDVHDGGLALFENYRAMAEANGVAPDDPALVGCAPMPTR